MDLAPGPRTKTGHPHGGAATQLEVRRARWRLRTQEHERRQPSPPARRGIARWWDEYGEPVRIYALSRAVVIVVAIVAGQIAPRPWVGSWPRVPGPRIPALQALGRWDGAWYLHVMTRGYVRVRYRGTVHATVAFFPGYSALAGSIAWLTHLPVLVVAIATSTVLGGVAAVLAWALVRDLVDHDAARRAVTLFSFAPGAFVFSMAYSEAMFLVVAIGCVLALVRRQWWLAGALAAASTFTRPNGVAVAFTAALVAFVAIRERGEWRALAAPLLAPLGVLAYFTYTWLHFGYFTMWFDVQRNGWDDRIDPIGAVVDHVGGLFTSWPSLGSAGLNDLQWVLFTGVSVVLVWLLWKWRPPLPVLGYGIAAAVFAMTSYRVGLRPRMILIAFPLVLAPGVMLRGRAYRIVLGASATLMVALALATFTSLAATP